MKSKFYLAALWTSIFCTSTVYGEKCPDLRQWKGGKHLTHGWIFINAKENLKKVNTHDLIFQGARITKKGAVCDYAHIDTPEETAIQFHNPNIHEARTSHPQEIYHSFRKGKGRPISGGTLCQGKTVDDCFFELRPTDSERLEIEREEKRNKEWKREEFLEKKRLKENSAKSEKAQQSSRPSRPSHTHSHNRIKPMKPVPPAPVKTPPPPKAAPAPKPPPPPKPAPTTKKSK